MLITIKQIFKDAYNYRVGYVLATLPGNKSSLDHLWTITRHKETGEPMLFPTGIKINDSYVRSWNLGQEMVKEMEKEVLKLIAPDLNEMLSIERAKELEDDCPI